MLKLAQSKVRFCVCSCCFACVHVCSFLFRNKIVHPLFLYACFICCSHAVSVNFKNEMAFLFVNGCRGKFWPVSRLLEWEQVPSQSLTHTHTHTLTHTCTASLILRPIFQQICLYKASGNTYHPYKNTNCQLIQFTDGRSLICGRNFSKIWRCVLGFCVDPRVKSQ